jgi:hypothetical protein
VGHDANSYQPEGTGDVSPWLSSRQIVNSAQDCGFAPKMYRQKNTNIPARQEKGRIRSLLGQVNGSEPCEYHLKLSVVGGNKRQRGRTSRRLLLVAQGSRSSAKEIFAISLVEIDAEGEEGERRQTCVDGCRWGVSSTRSFSLRTTLRV